MTKTRQNIVGIVIGGRGTGKSVFIESIVRDYPKKVIIYDTNVNRKYKDYPIIERSRLPLWRSGKYRIIDTDVEETIKDLLKLKNCLIVLEDTTKYVGSTMTKDLETLILQTKQVNVDLLMVWHAFRGAPPKIFNYCNMLEVFKTKERKISSFENKIPEFEDVEAAWIKACDEFKKGNYYYHSTVLID